MNTRRITVTTFSAALLSFAVALLAANTMPLARAWNIRASGTPSSSGELLFRVTPRDGEDRVEVTVSVHSGSSEIAVARDIRQALSTQLRRDRFDVQLGEGANVFVVDPHGKPDFSVELIDSDIENLRVAVLPVEPAASPTVPAQAEPAITQPPPTPPQPGAATPPTENPMEAVPPAPASPNGAPPVTAPPGTTPEPAAPQPAAPAPDNAPPPPGAVPPSAPGG